MPKFLSAKVLPHLVPDKARDTVRRHVNGGRFGAVYITRGRQRGRLLLLRDVVDRIGIGEAEIASAISAYEAARKSNRPAIISLEWNAVEQITD